MLSFQLKGITPHIYDYGLPLPEQAFDTLRKELRPRPDIDSDR